MKFKIGEKVIPISKSIGVDFKESTVIKKMKEKKQGYLFIIRKGRVSQNIIECSEKKDLSTFDCDHFLESDLKPYKSTLSKFIEEMEKKTKE